MKSTPPHERLIAEVDASVEACERRPTYGQQRLPGDRKGTLWLIRLKVAVIFQSSIEEHTLICLDADPSVLGVRRAEPVTYHDVDKLSHTYHADYFVTRAGADGTPRYEILECKPWKLLLDLLRNDLYAWQARREVFRRQNLPLLIVTDRDLDGPRLKHAQDFGPFVDSVPTPDLQALILKELTATPLLLGEVVRRVKMRVAAALQTTTWQLQFIDTLYGMIARGEVHVDRTDAPTEDRRIWPSSMAGPPDLALLAQPIKMYFNRLEDGWEADEPEPGWEEDPQLNLDLKRLLGTERGRNLQVLFSRYNDPRIPLDEDLRAELRAAASCSDSKLFRFQKLLHQVGAPGITFQTLVPRLLRLGKAPSRTLDPAVQGIMRAHTDSLYLVSVGKKDRYANVSALHKEVQKDCLAQGLPVPALSTVIDSLERRKAEDPVEFVRLRDGANEASKVKARLGQYLPTYYGEVLAIDCTPCDVFHRTDEIELMRRPRNTREKEERAKLSAKARAAHTERATMVTMVEVATSEVVLSYPIRGHATAADILGGMSRLMLGDQGLARDAGVQLLSPFSGLPVKIRLDSGSEFNNSHIERALMNLGISVISRNKGTRHEGGVEERTIGTLVRTQHSLPGTTMHNTEARREYDARRGATLSFETLSTYHQLSTESHNDDHRPNQGLTRHEHALQLIEQGRVRLRQPTPEQRQFLLEQMLPNEHRSCGREGIELFGLRFVSFDREFQRLCENKTRVQLLYTPSDLRTIKLVHPDTGKLLILTARPQDGLDFQDPLPRAVWDAFKTLRATQQKGIKTRKKSSQALFEQAQATQKSTPGPAHLRPTPPGLAAQATAAEEEDQITPSAIESVPHIRA